MLEKLVFPIFTLYASVCVWGGCFGLEVKTGEVTDVKIGQWRSLHLAQACLGAIDGEGDDPVHLYIIVDGKRFVLATLYPKSLPTQEFNLVFVENFKLSHDMKNTSVHFFGTQNLQLSKIIKDSDDEKEETSIENSDDEEEEIAVGL
ncbi:unnamed protein product [Lactuca virosa]|uniref:Nucleoplasmin-like domain-containing protein n=1 Tax=Lactuca virosa TaxID=75947 RepID=A0AAU9PAN1_9ASTR|nr:unnamed protein product [Lactuca virosa]